MLKAFGEEKQVTRAFIKMLHRVMANIPVGSRAYRKHVRHERASISSERIRNQKRTESGAFFELPLSWVLQIGRSSVCTKQCGHFMQEWLKRGATVTGRSEEEQS